MIGFKTAGLVTLFAVSMLSTSSAWTANAGLPDFTGLVEENSQAVVNISTTQKIKRGKRGGMAPHGWGGPGGAPLDDLLRRFFGEGAPGAGSGGPSGPDEEYESESLGSGFIVSDDGYILTNSHVIRDADEIIVRLSDRRELVAEVVGMDKRSDVALLKVEAENLPIVKIGNPNDLKVGSWVLAIGSPFGFDHSVTAGIVSAKGRSLPDENYVPFIQTDVAINPGNSGGPLFNLDGQVIGINSQIYSRTGGYMGLAFAIPIDVAMNVSDQLKDIGHVTRGWLGVLIQDVTRELAESFGMDKPIGALVAKVLPDSPSEKAGITVGDIIVEFNGKEVSSSSALPPIVGVSPVGEKANVRVIRDGKSLKLKVTISEIPSDDEISLSRSDGRDVKIERLSMVVSNLSDDERSQLEIEDAGIYVDSITSGAASHAGIRRGDVILKLNNIDIQNVRHFKGVVDDLPADKSFPILVMRRSGPVFLALKIIEED